MPCVQVDVTEDADPIDPGLPSGGGNTALLLGVSAALVLAASAGDD